MADGDVPNGSTCGRNGCGHKGSFHGDTATGDNTGKCSFMGCKCTAFQAKTAAASSSTIRYIDVKPGDPAVLATDEQRALIDPATSVAGPQNPTQVSPDGPQFQAVLIREGVDTDDERAIAPNALTWRELPMSLMVLTVTGPGGHQGAAVGARIDTIERRPGNDPGTFDIVALGHLDTGAVGLEATRMIGNQTLRGVSADLVACEGYVEVLEEDEDGFILKQRETLTAGKIAAATVCPIPAFNGCTIALVEESAMADEPEQAPALVASGYTLPPFRIVDEGRCLPCEEREAAAIVASGGPMRPPTAWFTDPGMDRLTALTIDDDGRVYGHLAAWDTCHTGIDGECVVAPRSSSNYAFYSTGAVRCVDGTDVPTGPITLGGGHAAQTLDADATRAHYDESGLAVADVAAGEDAWGIWVAGALRPDVTDLQVRQLRACALSGDWRRIGGRFELVAALAVNHPGFPIARVASGVPMSLVAAGARAVAKQARPWRDELAAVRREFEVELAQVRADRAMRRIRR